MIADDPALGREVEDHRDRFVYGPEPFDLEGLRRMRRLQIEQLVQPGTMNAKYSPAHSSTSSTLCRPCRSSTDPATPPALAQHA